MFMIRFNTYLANSELGKEPYRETRAQLQAMIACLPLPRV